MMSGCTSYGFTPTGCVDALDIANVSMGGWVHLIWLVHPLSARVHLTQLMHPQERGWECREWEMMRMGRGRGRGGIIGC